MSLKSWLLCTEKRLQKRKDEEEKEATTRFNTSLDGVAQECQYLNSELPGRRRRQGGVSCGWKGRSKMGREAARGARAPANPCLGQKHGAVWGFFDESHVQWLPSVWVR
jgi:hypothetical protein